MCTIAHHQSGDVGPPPPPAPSRPQGEAGHTPLRDARRARHHPAGPGARPVPVRPRRRRPPGGRLAAAGAHAINVAPGAKYHDRGRAPRLSREERKAPAQHERRTRAGAAPAGVLQDGLNASDVATEERLWTQVIDTYAALDKPWVPDVVRLRCVGGRGARVAFAGSAPLRKQGASVARGAARAASVPWRVTGPMRARLLCTNAAAAGGARVRQPRQRALAPGQAAGGAGRPQQGEEMD